MSTKKSKKSYLVWGLISVVLIIAAFIGGYFVGFKIQASRIDFLSLTSNIDYGDEVYVIGHKSPDTDTVCSAIAYANLKKQFGINAKPVVAGNLNNETKLVLDKFGVDAPECIKNADGKNMILVDHSEYSQAIDGMKTANIVEIFDHHSLGNIKSTNPLEVNSYPVGATATIVYVAYLEDNVAIDKQNAGLMLSAILSDTSNLSSETTTELDKKAVAELAKISQVGDVEAYFKDLQKALSDYSGLDDADIFSIDFKEYDFNGVTVGISCVNAEDEKATNDMCKRMSEVMKSIYPQKGMNHLYCMVKNKKDDCTMLLVYGDGAQDVADKVFGEHTKQDGIIKISPAVSRKKDVAPKLEKAYASK